MALRVHALLYKTYHVPGERVVCTVQVYNSAHHPGNGASSAAHLQELHFSSVGTERTDTHWIKKLYRSEVPPEHVDARKQTRMLYRADGPALLHDTTIPPGAAHQFRVRFRLPAVLPPTFRGQSCRFSYQLEVKALYSQQVPGSTTASSYETTAATSLTVWPWSPASQLPRQLTPLPSVPFPEQQPLQAAGLRTSLTPGMLPESPVSATPMSADKQPFRSGAEVSAYAAASTPTSAPAPAVGAAAAPAAAVVPSLDGQQRSPMLEYQLHQTIKVRFKEVPVDFALLHGHMADLQGGLPATGGMHTDSPRLPSTAQPSPNSSVASFAEHPHHLGSTNGLGSTSHLPLATNYHSSITNYSGMPVSANRSACEQYAAELQLQARSHMHNVRVRALQESESSDSDTEAMGAGAAGWRASRGGASASANSGLRPNPSLRGKLSLSGLSGMLKPPQPSLFGHAYSLKLREQLVMRVSLQAPLDSMLQPGSSFGGLLDLRPAGLLGPQSLVCHQLAVLLETEEVVAVEYNARAGVRSAAAPSAARKLVCEHQELTSHMATTQFLFSIPASATPSFETPMVSFRWLLRFELTVGPPLPAPGFGTASAKPAKQTFEQLLWSLPLYVQT